MSLLGRLGTLAGYVGLIAGMQAATSGVADAATLVITHTGYVNSITPFIGASFDPAVTVGATAVITYQYDWDTASTTTDDFFGSTTLNAPSATATLAINGNVIYSFTGSGQGQLAPEDPFASWIPNQGFDNVWTDPLQTIGLFSQDGVWASDSGWSPDYSAPFSYVPDPDISGSQLTTYVPNRPGYLQSAFITDTLVTGSGLAVAAVPEPASWAMMGIGFFALGAAWRRKRHPQREDCALQNS